MRSWPLVFALGALALSAGCAERSAFTQADLDRRAALTRCSALADARRPVWNAKQLLSRPGQPRPLSVEYQNEIDRRAADCLAGESPLRGRALDVPQAAAGFMAMYYFDGDDLSGGERVASNGGTVGKSIFDACVQVQPPIVAPILGYYFGRREGA